MRKKHKIFNNIPNIINIKSIIFINNVSKNYVAQFYILLVILIKLLIIFRDQPKLHSSQFLRLMHN
jgi:hypothetical protein